MCIRDRTGSLLFYRAVPPENPVTPEDTAALARELAPSLGLLLLVMGLTVAAGPIAKGAQAAASQLLQPQHYIQAVLKPGVTP